MDIVELLTISYKCNIINLGVDKTCIAIVGVTVGVTVGLGKGCFINGGVGALGFGVFGICGGLISIAIHLYQKQIFVF